MMMSRMLLSSILSSSVLVILLCFLQECNGRHLSSIHDHDHDHAMHDDKAKLLNRSTIKGLGNDLLTVPEVLDFKMTSKGNNQTNTSDDDHKKQTDRGSKNKKDDMIKDQKVKKFKELDHHHHHHQHEHHPKSISFRVPLKHRKIHQQPAFNLNLDYAPPKTHPPSHN